MRRLTLTRLTKHYAGTTAVEALDLQEVGSQNLTPHRVNLRHRREEAVPANVKTISFINYRSSDTADLI